MLITIQYRKHFHLILLNLRVPRVVSPHSLSCSSYLILLSLEISLVALLGIFQAYLCMWRLPRNNVDITCNGRSGEIDGMQFGFMK